MQKQRVTEYWWEGSSSAAIPPSASDIVCRQNKTGDNTFGGVFVCMYVCMCECVYAHTQLKNVFFFFLKSV